MLEKNYYRELVFEKNYITW